jgi:hypothetical protein
MKSEIRSRDLRKEQRERDRFVLLQHLCLLSDNMPGILLPERRVWERLEYEEAEAVALLESLHWEGYVAHDSGWLQIAATRKGVDYIESMAHRRRSVRFPR